MSELFNGTWEIDLEKSRVWDPTEGRYLVDAVGRESITLHTENGVQDFEVLYGDDPTFRMGYSSRYDDPEWVPYLVKEIIPNGRADDLDSVISDFKKRIKADSGPAVRNFAVGEPYGMVRTVYMSDRIHYRVLRSDKGIPQAMIMRRLSEDGNSFVASVLDPDGILYRIRHFNRTGH